LTESYLDKCYKGEVLALKKDQIKQRNFQKTCSKLEIFEAINDVIRENGFKPLGFDETNLPNKDWLLDYLVTLKSNHEFFQRDQKARLPELLDKLSKE